MKIHYVTGSRADFGLMEKTLKTLHNAQGLELGVIVTGQHLVKHYGDTYKEVLASGLPIVHEIPVLLSGAGGAEMSLAMATELSALTEFWQVDRPDMVLVLGDRGEMLSAALAAVHLGIFVGHLHGGEVSGTLDESFRHAISKLSHFHFPATIDSQDRLIAMGENPSHIWAVGAPGLVGLTDRQTREATWFPNNFGFKPSPHNVILVFHPVVQEAELAGKQVEIILSELIKQDCAGLIMRPNSDAGGAAIDAVLDRHASDSRFAVRDHLDRTTYLDVLAQADLIVGNSSSGIIESASFDLPCLNIGSRQHGRLRNENVVDCPDITPNDVRAALQRSLSLGRGPFTNQYGDGNTADRLRDILTELSLDPAILAKTISY